MQANPLTIDALFNSQLRYVVPMFQRIYVWKQNPQWTTLWEDIVEKSVLQIRKIPSNPHYLGALIIEGVRPSSPREVKRFLVIDGQQRLTTLQLLFCSFRDVARAKNWNAIDISVSRYLENANPEVMEDSEQERYKLWPTSLNRNIFRSILSAGSSPEVERRHPHVYVGRKRKPEPRSLLVEAYLYFSRVIAAWVSDASRQYGIREEDCAFLMLQAMQQDFCVVEISLSEGDDS